MVWKLGTPDAAAVNSFLQFQRHHARQESARLLLNTSNINLPFSYKELEYPYRVQYQITKYQLLAFNGFILKAKHLFFKYILLNSDSA